MKPIRPLIALAALVAGGLTTLGSTSAGAARAGSCPLPKFGPGHDYHPTIHPSSFSAKITNPWFPMHAGTTFIYAGADGKTRTTDIVAVSKHTKQIDGVTTRVVYDRVLINGRVSERTADFYSQDRCGNVWYFGENTAELKHNGQVRTTAGSFEAGVDGAEPGVLMQAHPTIGREFRQEWKQGVAEDQFKAVGKHASRAVPYGTFHHLLRTSETDGLEPAVLEHKYYARGVGDVAERTVKGAHERLQLVDVLH